MTKKNDKDATEVECNGDVYIIYDDNFHKYFMLRFKLDYY